MDFISTTLAFTKAIGFTTAGIFVRRLQEAGASPLGTFKLYGYALVPAVIWGLVVVRPEDISRIIHTPMLLTFVLLVPVIWNVQVFLTFSVLNTTSSLSGFASLQRLIALPLSLLVGMFFNHDIPNFFGVLALVALGLSLIVQPAPHASNNRARYSKPFLVIAGILLLKTTIETIRFGLDRQILKTVSPETYIGVFVVLALSLCVLWTSLVRTAATKNDKSILRQHTGLVILIPAVWFGSTILEEFALASLPIFIITAIATVTFGMYTVSDLVQKRIRFNLRTATFIVLFLGGTVLAVISI